MPLSREHHEALVLARRACSTEPGSAGFDALCRRVLQRWSEQFEPHFAVEERVLFPALARAGGAERVAHALRQHALLRAAAAELRAGDTTALAGWGAAMDEHVRFEERELFPLAERLLDLPALAAALGERAPPSVP